MQSIRILIAEDNSLLRMELKVMLERNGHCVIGEAADGEAACRMARSLKPDAVLLDIMMPQMTGLEAAEIINQERLGAVLMLTAYSDAAMIEHASKAGVLAYLVKPYREQELIAALAVASTRYREMQALEGALENAHEQMEISRIVSKAKKILIQEHALSEQEAIRRLQALALSSSLTLREAADAVILSQETLAGLSPRSKHK